MTEQDASRAEQEYLLGTNDEELSRLGFQNEVWSEYASRAWEKAGFGPDQTLLDLGCGPGYATFELARLVGPRGKVIAVDGSPRFIRYLESQKDLRGATNIFTQLGNVEDLQFRPASIDGAFIRWVLCYLSKPESVIDTVAGALKPGGALVIHDYFYYRGVVVAPHSEIFDRIFHAVDRSFRAAGGDPDILSRVPAMILHSGLQIQELNPMTRIARPGSALWKWPERFLQNFLPRLLESGFVTTAEITEFQDEWEKRSRDPAAFFGTPPMLELIAVKK